MKNTANDLWVFIETSETGSAKNVGLELINASKPIVKKLGGRLVAIIIGHQINSAIKSAEQSGADLIIAVDNKVFEHYFTDSYVNCFYQLIKKHSPNTILIGATDNGRDMAPRISCRLKTGLTADCTGIDFDSQTGNILWTRPTFGGNLMATIECPQKRPQMGTIRPGVFKKIIPDLSRKVAIIYEDIMISPNMIRTKLIKEIDQHSDEQVNLEEAEIIVAGGLGVGSPNGFKVLLDFADAIGGVVAASRPVIDAGWVSLAHQVGQTGKSVSPKLYIACGISGAIQHLAGISGAECIVAINSDPTANIFNAADYGIVGDIFEVIPALKAEFDKFKSKIGI